jgi:hypothetical protein
VLSSPHSWLTSLPFTCRTCHSCWCRTLLLRTQSLQLLHLLGQLLNLTQKLPMP